MKFQTKWRNYTWIVRKTGRRFYPNGDSELIPGVIVRFEGPGHIFDSVLAQEQNEWDDDTRVMVENKLLKRADFGFGIYLAPGEQLDQEQRALIGDKLAIPAKRCAFIWVPDGTYDVTQCPDNAIPGEEFCQDHTKSKIVQGMLTTKGA